MRNPTFDIVKGIGIVLMLLGHMGLPLWIWKFIFSFHMPLFLIVSGYFAKSCEESHISIGQGLCKDSKRLLWPYFVTSVLIVLFALLRGIVKGDMSIVAEKAYDMLYVTHDTGPIWFLVALFWIRVLFRPIMKCKQWALPVSILFSGVAVIIVHHVMQLPFCILTGLAAMVFYAIGWWQKRFGFPRWLIVVGAVCWMCMLVWGDLVKIYRVEYWIYPITILGASGATYLIYLLVKHLSIYLSIIGRVLEWIGMNSLVILCIHGLDIHCCWVSMSLSLVGIELSYWPLTIIRYTFVGLACWLYIEYVKPWVKGIRNE